jgi:transposase-like protein
MEVGQLALGKNDTPLGEGIINNQAKGGNNMEGNQGRHMSAEEKLKIVVEGRQSGATVSEVCRRHQIACTQFYRWERMAKEGALEMLRNGVRKAKMRISVKSATGFAPNRPPSRSNQPPLARRLYLPRTPPQFSV